MPADPRNPSVTAATAKATPLRSIQWNTETAAGAIAIAAVLFLVLVAHKLPVSGG